MSDSNASNTKWYWLAGAALLMTGVALGIYTVKSLGPASGLADRPVVVERIELGAPTGSRQLSELPPQIVTVEPAQLSGMFKNAANAIRESVVFIQVTTLPTEESWYQNLENRFFDDQFERQSVGSGVIISKEGYIVTNHHVVAGARSIIVTLEDKREYAATTVGSDPATDLAVLKIDDDAPFKASQLGDSDALEVGEWVLAVGNPFRLTSTVTAGIVSALGRHVNIIDSRFGIEDFIQTDAAINPGNSGGALVNLQGELVGINTAIATESGSSEGYGFAVPVRLVERIAADLITYGEVKRGYLGVEIQAVDAAVAGRVGLDRIGGVLLNSVSRGGAAHRAGLRRGDIILSVDNTPVDAPNELQSAVARRRPGDTVDMSIWRRGDQIIVDVVLEGKEDPATSSWLTELDTEEIPVPEMPPLDEHPDNVTVLENIGLGIANVDPDLAELFDVTDGVYIAFVRKGSVADLAGLKRDKLIVSVNDLQVANIEDVERAFASAESSESILIETVRTDGVKSFYEILSTH